MNQAKLCLLNHWQSLTEYATEDHFDSAKEQIVSF
jgi:hypothetical protein